MKLSEELAWRGFVNQTTFANLSELNKKSIFYHGYDASSDSLTIGNLAAVMLDKLFIKHGHKAVLLAGGATSLIGDPGGKDSERPMQDFNLIEKNVASVEKQILNLLGSNTRVVNNLTWFRNMNILEFLRDVGKHFSMTPLVQRDYIAKRMGSGGSGISYTEFSYTLLQGYDYLYLHKKYGVNLQLAGSDQWGNCLSGIALTRRVTGQEVNAFTMPLIVNQSTGKKFGKSEAGAVWLDSKKTSPTEFYQFWINLDDKGVINYLKIFTELEPEKITEIMKKHLEKPEARLAQKELAEAVTKMVHGAKDTNSATDITEVITGQKDLRDVSRAVIKGLKSELPSAKAPSDAPIIEVLVKSGLAQSNTEAVRLIKGGAVYLNNQKVSRSKLEKTDFTHDILLLRRGKAFKDSALIIRG